MKKTISSSPIDFIEVGLSQKQATHNLQTYGYNQVIGKKPPNDLYFLLKQFRNPLVFVLLIAIVVTSLIGDFSDAFVIALAVLVNTALGFVQERKAFKSLEALKKVVNHSALVIRDGNRVQIDASHIVPGDIVVVFEGDKIPADGIVVENNDLMIAEAILTGESLPVEKATFTFPETLDSISEIIAQRDTYVPKIGSQYKTYMGTVVTSGSAKILVSHTGMKTQLGSIAADIEEHQEVITPLEKKLNALARFIAFGIIILCILIFAIGVITQRDPVEMFTTAVAIAVAAIPEGLVIGLTAILAIGMRRIHKRKGLVRTLVAAETLGSVTVVCVDKTGTLTEGKMRVSAVKTNDEVLLYKASTLANDRKDPIEVARWNWAQKIAAQNKIIAPEQLTIKHKRTTSLPFSVERRFLAVQIANELFLAGAPEEMIDRSNASQREKKEYETTIKTWASEGKRLIGFGYVKTENSNDAQGILKSLKNNSKTTQVQWVGLMAFDDPVRPSVIESIKKTQQAGVAVKVITGDYASTAISVLKQIGIPISETQFIEGNEVESLSVRQLQEKMASVILFARTKPSHKLKIVNALKKNGEIVAMMGDGVNDAPALATADIGIVVEEASEVAKESSELILLDSNMNTIIAAIEEGRAMFDNLRKIILYLLSDSFSELLIVLISILAGTPLAITAVQILWINLINDGLPNLALTIDPKSPGLLKRKPLPKTAKLINSEMLFLILIISVTTAFGSLLAFRIFLPSGIEVARTVVFAILSIDSLLYVFSCRSLERNIWHDNLLNNKPLLLSVGFGFILTVLSVYLPSLQKLLGTHPLSMNDWIVVGVISLSVIVVIETFKWMWNNLSKR
ncbi:MAG: ATPase [Patescibacteria group bacterium]|nr:MAG: ATPase [Patescibacteria group bacterium]